MARRVKVSVIGDAASFAAAVRKGIAATGDLEVALVDLQTAAVKTTEVQIAASLKREARLRTEAKAAKGFSASLTEDAFARNAADNATIRSQQKLSRGLGYTTQAEVAKSAAAIEIESTMAVKQALETKIAAFRAAAADETRTVGQRETSNELAVKTEKELARVMGVTAASAAASAKEQTAGLKEVEAENLSASQVAKAAAEADFAARMKKIEGLELEIAAHKEAAAAAGPGVEQTQMNNLAQQKQLQLDKLLADASQAKAAAEVNGNKSIQVSLDETIALREAEIKTIREEIVELQARARAAKAGSPAQFAIAGTLATKQKRLGVLEKAGAPLAVPTVLTAHDKASTFVKDEAARLHGLREEIIATEALATDDTLLSSERNIAAKRTRALYRELANAISEEGVAAKGAGAVIREQTERQIALSIQKQTALQSEIALTKKAAAAAVAGSQTQIALDEKRIGLQNALNAEIEQSAVAQNVSLRAAAKTSKEFNTGVRGVLAGSGVFKMLGRSLAFASSGFLAFSLGAFAIRKAVDNAVELQKQMEYLHTQAGATTAEVEKMTGAVERLAPALGTNPDVLAKGLYHIESSGLRGKQAMDALTVAAKGAVIGGSDLEDTATALIATWKSGVSGVTSFATAMSAANAIVGAGNMRMQDLVKSLSTPLLATAKTAGISIDGIGAALDVLTIKWGPNSNAATRLAMAINLLSSPTAQAQKELAKIGITQTQLGDAMRTRGLPAALDILKSKMEEMGLTATQQGILLTRAFGGGRSSGAVKVLIQSIDDLRKKQHQIAEQIGTLDEKWAATVKTAEFAGRKWKASVSSIETELGANLLPTLTKTANGFAHWMSQEKNQAAIQNDFADGIKVTGFALKTTWAAAQPFIAGFQQMSRTVGGATHGVELLAAALVSMKVHNKFFASFRFSEIATGFKTIAATIAKVGFRMEALKVTLGTIGAMILKNARGLGLIAAVGGTQIHNLPGLNNAAGRGVGDVVSNTGAGLFAGSFFGRTGTIVGGSLGLGRGLHQAIGGTGGDFAGNIVSGAAIGATKGPYGALAGAAIGLTKSFIDLTMSGHSAADELKKISSDRNKAQFAAKKAHFGLLDLRNKHNADVVQVETQAGYVQEAKQAEIATRGTKQHRLAVDQLRYAQSEYRALVRQVKADERSLGSARVNEAKATKAVADQTNKMVKKLQDMAQASRELKTVQARWSNVAAAQKTSAEKLQDYVQKMNKLGDSFEKTDPKAAAVYHQIAKIAIQLGLIPSNKIIDIWVREHRIFIPGKGASTPHPGQQGRADQMPGAGNVMVPTEPPKKKPKPIRTLTMPERFAIQEAKAITDKQEIAAAKSRLAYVNKLLASGRLVDAALLDALTEKKSDIQTIAGYAKTKAKKGKSTSISKLVDPKIRDKVAQAAAAYAADANKDTTAAYVKALKEEREWVQRRLKQGHLTGNQKVALDNEIKSINTKISAALKKTIKDNWDIPLKLQLAQAKAGATLTNTDDLNVAEKIKSAAQKALSSGKLGIKAQIDAWNTISSANDALANSWLKSRNQMHAVSVRALLSGIHFKTLLDKQEAESRLAQRQGHRGYAPNKGAIFGNPVGKATGGAIPGVGSGDTVPAMLTPGEIVLNKRQQRNTRKMLGMGDGSPDELFGRINRFADGGVVFQHFKTGGPAGGVSTSDAREIALRILRQRIHPDKPVHFFRNALADAKSIVNPKTYLQLVKHPVSAAKGTFSFYKDLVKHPLTTFEQHPVFTALALKGAVKGVVKGGGLAARGTAGIRTQYVAESAAARAEQPFNLFKDWAEAFHGPDSIISGSPGSIAGLARKAASRPHIPEAFSRLLHEERASAPFSERLLNRFYAFHGTHATAGRSIAREGFVTPNELGQVHVGDFAIARTFANRNIEGTPGSFAFTRRGRAERGQAMIAKTDPIRALGVISNVDRHTTPMRAFARYLLDRHKLGSDSAISRLFHEERGSIGLPERRIGQADIDSHLENVHKSVSQKIAEFWKIARQPVATGPKPVSDLFAPDFTKMGPAPDVIARTEKTARMRENFTKMMEKSDRMAKYEKMGRPLAGHEPLHRGEYFMGGFGRLLKQIDTYRTFYDVARDKGLPNALRKRPANTVEVADKFGVSWIDLLVAGRGKLGEMSSSVPAFVKAHQRLKRFAKSRSDVGGEISKAAQEAGYGGHGHNVYGLTGDQTVGPGMASWMAVADWLGQNGKREMLGETGRVYHNQRYSFEKLQRIGEEFSKHRNAGGGVIGGSGMGDTVPALLSPGEMVLNRRQQRSLGRAVGAADPAMLFSKIKRFAGGGFVSDHRIAWRTSSDQRITATKVSIVAQKASLNRPDAMGMAVTSGRGDNIVINVNGAKDPKQTAKDVMNELQKHRKRNAAQRRGRHGGHSSLGLT